MDVNDNPVRITMQMRSPLEMADEIVRLNARVAALTAALTHVVQFLDNPVRAWLPREHTECAIDSGCSHGDAEAEMFEKLDAEIVAAIDAAGGAP